MSKPLLDKTILITGAARGLGRALALSAASEGVHIIAMGRTIGALEELDDEIRAAGSSATLIPMDLMDSDAIDALGPTLFERFDKLDGFIANAAYLGGLAPLTHTKTAEWEKIIKTNLTANFALIRTLTPLLTRAEAGRALFITDHQDENFGKAYWGPYSASKAALEALVATYAGECASTTIKAALLNPAPMPTALRRKAYPGEEIEPLTPVNRVAKTIIEKLIEDEFTNGETLTIKP